MASWLEPLLLIGLVLFGTGFAIITARGESRNPLRREHKRSDGTSAETGQATDRRGSHRREDRETGLHSLGVDRHVGEDAADITARHEWQPAEPADQTSIRHVAPIPPRPPPVTPAARQRPEASQGTDASSHPEPPETGHPLSDDGAAHAAVPETLHVTRVYVLHIDADPITGTKSVNLPQNAATPPATADHATHLVVERTTVTISRDQYEEVAREIEQLAPPTDRVNGVAVDALAEYLSEKITERGWNAISHCWVTHDPGHLDQAVQNIDSFETELHDLMLQQPVEATANWLSVPGPVSEIVGDITAQIALPIDRPLHEIKRDLQIAGIVLSVVTGVHPLAIACVESFAHDQLMHAVTDCIKDIAKDLIGPADPHEHIDAPDIAESIEPVTPEPEPVSDEPEAVDEIESPTPPAINEPEPPAMEELEPHPPRPDLFEDPF